jgi:hypothetical protein
MTDLPPPHLVSAAQMVLGTLDTAGIPACLIGGMVIARWGQPRATTDADFTVLAPYGEEERVLDVLLARFRPRRPDARAFALDHRVVLLQTAEGVNIDVALAAFPFEIEAIEHATPWRLGGSVALRTCSAEHLLVYKLVAGRPQDLIDVEGIVRRQRDRLEVDRIRRWGREFAELKEDPDLLRPFEDVWRQLGLPPG